MKIAVTGSEGQLGGELCRLLKSRAIGLDRPELDLTDAAGVRKLLLGLRPEAVINTAAYTLVDRAEQEPELCQAVNAGGVAHLAEVCRELACPLAQISTDYVFGLDASRQTPYREEDPPGPQGAYARSKLEGERQAARCERHLIVRTCGLYGLPGPRTAGRSFIDTMLKLAGEKKQLRVVGDQHCTPSYVPHVARAIVHLLDSGAQGIFHVVNTGQTTWYDFAREVFRQAEIEASVERITAAEYGAPAPRPGYSVLDTSKYHALAGPAMPHWRQGVAEYLSLAAARHAPSSSAS